MILMPGMKGIVFGDDPGDFHKIPCKGVVFLYIIYKCHYNREIKNLKFIYKIVRCREMSLMDKIKDKAKSVKKKYRSARGSEPRTIEAAGEDRGTGIANVIFGR